MFRPILLEELLADLGQLLGGETTQLLAEAFFRVFAEEVSVAQLLLLVHVVDWAHLLDGTVLHGAVRVAELVTMGQSLTAQGSAQVVRRCPNVLLSAAQGAR